MSMLFRTILLFSGLIILNACSKDEENPFPYWWGWNSSGTVEVIKNGALLKDALVYGHDHGSDPDRQYHPGIAINIQNYISGSTTESLSFNQIPCEVGKHLITSQNIQTDDEPYSSYLTIIGGDVVGDSYNLDFSKENFFEITSIEGEDVTAAFQVNFKIDTSRTKINPDLPDNVSFQDGLLHTKLNAR